MSLAPTRIGYAFSKSWRSFFAFNPNQGPPELSLFAISRFPYFEVRRILLYHQLQSIEPSPSSQGKPRVARFFQIQAFVLLRASSCRFELPPSHSELPTSSFHFELSGPQKAKFQSSGRGTYSWIWPKTRIDMSSLDPLNQSIGLFVLFSSRFPSSEFSSPQVSLSSNLPSFKSSSLPSFPPQSLKPLSTQLTLSPSQFLPLIRTVRPFNSSSLTCLAHHKLNRKQALLPFSRPTTPIKIPKSLLVRPSVSHQSRSHPARNPPRRDNSTLDKLTSTKIFGARREGGSQSRIQSSQKSQKSKKREKQTKQTVPHPISSHLI